MQKFPNLSKLEDVLSINLRKAMKVTNKKKPSQLRKMFTKFRNIFSKILRLQKRNYSNKFLRVKTKIQKHISINFQRLFKICNSREGIDILQISLENAEIFPKQLMLVKTIFRLMELIKQTGKKLRFGVAMITWEWVRITLLRKL